MFATVTPPRQKDLPTASHGNSQCQRSSSHGSPETPCDPAFSSHLTPRSALSPISIEASPSTYFLRHGQQRDHPLPLAWLCGSLASPAPPVRSHPLFRTAALHVAFELLDIFLAVTSPERDPHYPPYHHCRPKERFPNLPSLCSGDSTHLPSSPCALNRRRSRVSLPSTPLARRLLHCDRESS